MNEFRADLKDYAFFFSLSVDRRKKKRGVVGRRKKQKKSAQWRKRQELPLS